MPFISIRQAEDRDFCAVRTILDELDQQFWPQNKHLMRKVNDIRLTRKRFRKWLSKDVEINPQHRLFVAEMNSKIVGVMLLCLNVPPEDHHRMFRSFLTVQIEEIAVAKAARGNGAGRELIEFARVYAKSINAEQLTVGTMSNQIKSVEFYEHIFGQKADQILFTQSLK